MMATPDFETSVDTMVRALTFVSDTSNLDVVPSIAKGNQEKHAIGLGAMGLAAYFAQNQMYYGDEASLDLRNILHDVELYSIKASMKLAKERQEKFFEFDKSAYADGTYFDKYLTQDWAPKTPKVALPLLITTCQHNVTG